MSEWCVANPGCTLIISCLLIWEIGAVLIAICNVMLNIFSKKGDRHGG
jgi:hypothetical protein